MGHRGHSVLAQSSASLHTPSLGQLKQAPSLSVPRSCLYREPLSHSLAGFSPLPNIPPLLALSALISPVPVAPTPPAFPLTLSAFARFPAFPCFRGRPGRSSLLVAAAARSPPGLEVGLGGAAEGLNLQLISPTLSFRRGNGVDRRSDLSKVTRLASERWT